MATNWQTFPVEVKGGLIEILPSIQQGDKAPGSAILLKNFEPSLKGGYRRIDGYVKFDTNEVPAVDTSTQLLGVGFLNGQVVVPREDGVYSSTGSGWTTVVSGRTQTTKVRYSTINLDGTRKLIGVDGVNYPYSYDGTTLTNLSGSVDILGASHVAQFKDHIFYAIGSSVVFSEPFDENGFDTGLGAGNFIMPNEITGLIVFRERLFVFTETEISVLDGDSSNDFRLTSVSESVGCIRPDTIKEVGGDVVFLSADGLRLLGGTDRIGDFRNENVSKNIQVLMDEFSRRHEVFNAVAIRSKSQYRIFAFDANQQTAVAEGFLGTQFEPANPNSFEWGSTLGLKVYSVVSEVYQGAEKVYFVSDTGFVYQMETGDDFDGTAISAEYRTPFISFGDPMYRKTIYKVRTYVGAEGSMVGTLQLSFDQGSTTKLQPGAQGIEDGGGISWGNFSWDEGNWASGEKEGSVSVSTVGAGNSVSLEYTFTDPQAPFTIDTIFIEYAVEDRR